MPRLVSPFSAVLRRALASAGALLAGACFAQSSFTLNGLSNDAEARRATQGDGGGTLASASATSLFIGNTNSGSASFASPVYVFQLPNLGAVANPFATASFSVALVSASDFNGFSADVYGLGARDLPAVLADDAFAGGSDGTDATRVSDNWINLNGSGIATGLRTLSNAALVSYLNTQYAAGAGAGRYVFLRISPDGNTNVFKNTRFASSEDGNAANRPTLTYTLATLPPPNTAPTLPTQANRSVQALQTLSVTNTASDADLPAQTLTYQLNNPPAGASISASGVITWTPTIAQAGATYTISTTVTDSGSPALSATNSFQVTVPAYVPPPNTAPILPSQPNRNIAVGATLSVTNTATDNDLPAQTLSYELLQAPAGASISASGVITWTPLAAQGGATYTCETRVTDNGSPALSATNSFTVAVAEPGAYVRTLDLSTSGQFFQNFRISKPRDGGTSGQSGNLFSFDGVAGWTSSEIYTFDLTPNDPRTATQSTFPVVAPITVSFDARVTTAGSAVGVDFLNPHNLERNVLAYFNINAGADSFRFFKNTDGGYTGDQVGSTVSAATDTEPGGALVRVTVTLFVSGTTPTVTLSVPGAAPVVRAFAAGDFDWSQTLVAIRLADAGQGSGTPVQITNIEINAGGPPTPSTPPAPVPPVLPVGAPVAAGVNLLADNPSFESASVSFGNGSHSFAGWAARNQRFGSIGTTGAGAPGGGNRAFRIEWGGNLETAAASRPTVTPFHTYELTWSVRTTQVTWPEYRPGSTTRLDFYDANGVLLKSYWGPDWRPQVPGFEVTPWQTFTIRGVAPEGALRVGVRFIADAGQFIGGVGSREDNRIVEVDNFRLVRLEEPIDRLALRRAPRLLQPGATVELRIHHAATAHRALVVDLVNGAGQTVATGGYAVPAGRRLNTVQLTLPNSLPDGDYAWRVQLRPAGGGAAVATLWQDDAFADSTVAASTAANGRDFDADHPNLVFMGRIEDTNPKRRWMHWIGSEVRVRFSGTSLSLLGSAGPNGFGGATPTEVDVVINEDHVAAFRVSIPSYNESGSNVFPIISGLPDGVHTARIFKADESSEQVRVDGFRVDAGRGLLRAEPLSSRRLEIYGDSVTNGGNARLNYFGYAHRIGREMDLNLHVISKGGTGVASSFSGQDLLGNYWDKLSFPVTTNAAAGLPWDFSRFTPHGVVIAVGHNDQFNNGAAAFPAKYAEFLGKIRAQYGAALPVISTNTVISAPVSHFEGAVLPLLATDPKLRWVMQLSASAPIGAHPSTLGHAAMVDGEPNRYALPDVIEEQLGWGLSAPLSAYENWAVAHFSLEQRAAGQHAPEASPAGDGLSNLMRYALGAASPTAAVTPPAATLDGGGRLALSFRRAHANLRYIVETSGDLVAWQPAAINPGSAGGEVTWTDTVPAGPRRFVRLRVELP